MWPDKWKSGGKRGMIMSGTCEICGSVGLISFSYNGKKKKIELHDKDWKITKDGKLTCKRHVIQ